MEDSPRFTVEAVTRFGAGLAGAVLVGLAVFRADVLRPAHPAFEFVTAGALLAAILTLVRQLGPGRALALALALITLKYALAPVIRLGAIVSALLLGLGLFLAALVFDLLACRGWRFGKFVIIGPLVGGVFLALAPITESERMTVLNAAGMMLFRLALGLLIGEGVALGAELAELPFHRPARASPEATR